MKTSSILRRGLTAAAVLASIQLAPGQNIWTGGGGAEQNWSSALNWSLGYPPNGDPVLFQDNGAVTTVGEVNNIVDAAYSGTTGSFKFGNTNGVHTTMIANGATLSISGGLIAGTETASDIAGKTNTITGALGAINASGGNFIVRQWPVAGASSASRTTLDMSGLGSFTGNFDRMLIGVAGSGGNNRASGRVLLARTNVITLAGSEPQLDLGDSTSNNGNGSELFLGQKNSLFANSIMVGRYKERGVTMRFQPGLISPSLLLRGSDSSSRVLSLTVGYSGNGSGTANAQGTIDLTLGTLDGQVDLIDLGKGSDYTGSSGTTGPATGTFSFAAGTLDVNTLRLGYQPRGTSAAAATAGQGTMNVNGTALLNVNTLLAMGVTSGGAGVALTYGTLNINGGTVRTPGIVADGGGTNNTITISANGLLVISNDVSAGINTLAMTNGGLSIPASLSAAALTVTNLSVDGANRINILSVPAVSGYPAQFPIIKYSGTLNGTFDFALGTTPPSSPAYAGYISNNVANGSIDLILTSGATPARAIVWTGANGADWNTSIANWRVGATSTTYNQKDFVRFDDTATGSTSINIAENVAPSSITVSNSSKTYSLGGGAAITGPTGIIKDGSGTLNLVNSGLNDFSGTVEIVAGTLRVGDGSFYGTLGTGDVIDDGSLIFNYGTDITVANPISGEGSVGKQGTGNVTLAGANSYNGVTTVSAGILSVTHNSALGTTNGGTIVANGATLNVNDRNLGAEHVTVSGSGVDGGGAIINASATQQLNSLRYVTLAGNTVFGGAGRWDIRGAPSTADPANAGLSTGGNAYKLTKIGANQVSIVGATIDPALGDIDIQGGILAFETVTTSLGDPNRNVTVGAGGTLQFYNLTNLVNKKIFITSDGFTSSLNNGAGANTVVGPVTINNDSYFNINGTSLTLEGPVTGAQITKNGTGALIFNGTPTHAGTIVNAGKLVVNGVHNGAVTVGGGASLAGNGSAGAVQIDGTLFPGDTNVIGTLTAQSMIINGGINMDLGRNTTIGMGSNDLVQVNGQLTFNGGSITINPKGLLSTAAGTSYTLFRATGGIVYNGDPYVTGSDNYVFTIDKSTPGSLKVIVSGGPAVWNGASTTTSNWSDPANWGGVTVFGSSPVYFSGSARTVNNNDTPADTSYDIAFTPEASAFTLNGNAVTLMNTLMNNSTSTQTVNLPLNLGSANTISGTAGPIVLAGEVRAVNNLSILNAAGSGVFKNNFENPAGITNSIRMLDTNGNWSILDNAGSTQESVAMQLDIQAGTMSFGSSTSAPKLTTTTVNGAPSGDNRLGNVADTTATFNMVNGTLITTARFNTGAAANSKGVVNMSGGTWYLGGQFQGANGANTATSEFNISGGELHVANYGATLAYQSFFVASRGNAVLNVSGDANAKVATLDVSRSINSDITGTVNLDGGVLAVNRVSNGTANAGSATSGSEGIFNFNGGLLKAGASSTTWFQGRASGPAVPLYAYVKAGGARIDTDGFDVSFLEPLQHDSALGETADGGLVKSGAGALTLGAANTYTGPTVVNGGTLLVNGSIVSPTVTVNDGGALSGSGTINSAVTVKSGGKASAGTATAGGTLTVAGNLVFEAGATASMDLNKASTPANDKIVATSITYAGTLQLNSIGGALAVGDSFKLFDATSYNGSFSAIEPASPGPGLGWDTSALTTTGTITVVSVQPMSFGGISITGGNLVLNAANGPANGAYVILTSTDASLPVSSWTQLTSGNFDANGALSFTAPAPTDTQRFYIIQVQ